MSLLTPESQDKPHIVATDDLEWLSGYRSRVLFGAGGIGSMIEGVGDQNGIHGGRLGNPRIHELSDL